MKGKFAISVISSIFLILLLSSCSRSKGYGCYYGSAEKQKAEKAATIMKETQTEAGNLKDSMYG